MTYHDFDENNESSFWQEPEDQYDAWHSRNQLQGLSGLVRDMLNGKEPPAPPEAGMAVPVVPKAPDTVLSGKLKLPAEEVEAKEPVRVSGQINKDQKHLSNG